MYHLIQAECISEMKLQKNYRATNRKLWSKMLATLKTFKTFLQFQSDLTFK